MKGDRILVLLVTLMVTLVAVPAQADRFSQAISVFNKSEAVQPFFQNAYGYAVFPLIGKGGFVIGGAYGTGQVYRDGRITGTTSLIKATIGFQLGGQAFSEIIFFQDKRAYNEFISGNFEFDAAASFVVVTAGVQARAGTEGVSASATAGPKTGTQAIIRYQKGLAVFIHAKGGLMYEVAIGGQKFSFQAL
ncbi:MAG: lipid-binding SYLF domain-containing protein [Deltaproteobacteria bacterium]|nr:lipid-binding SYLF domain-containing protein [Deltaproteobacteria bacterium]